MADSSSTTGGVERSSPLRLARSGAAAVVLLTAGSLVLLADRPPAPREPAGAESALDAAQERALAALGERLRSVEDALASLEKRPEQKSERLALLEGRIGALDGRLAALQSRAVPREPAAAPPPGDADLEGLRQRLYNVEVRQGAEEAARLESVDKLQQRVYGLEVFRQDREGKQSESLRQLLERLHRIEERMGRVEGRLSDG